MAAIVRTDISTTSILIQELPTAFGDDNSTFLQDAGRSGDVVQYTLLGKIAATGKWKIYDPTSTDGSALALGVLMSGDVAEADIIAGDVTGLSILYANARLVEDMLTIEGATTLSTVIGTGVTLTTVRDALINQGIIFQLEQAITAVEG